MQSVKTIFAAGSLLLVAWLLSGCGAGHYRERAVVEDDTTHRVGTVLSFDASSATLASGGWEGEIALRPPTASPVYVWKAHRRGVTGLAFTDYGLLSAGMDGKLALWDTKGVRLYAVMSSAPITRMASDADRVITGHSDGSVRLWRLPGLDLEKQFEIHSEPVTAVAVDASQGRYASVARDARVFFWRDGSQPTALDQPKEVSWSLVFEPKGTRLYGGGWSELHRWVLPVGRLDIIETPHSGAIAALQFLPGRHVLASISRITDSSVYFLDPDTGLPLREFTKQGLCGGDIRVSGDGHYMAATGDDGVVRVWQLDASSGPRIVANKYGR